MEKNADKCVSERQEQHFICELAPRPSVENEKTCVGRLKGVVQSQNSQHRYTKKCTFYPKAMSL